MPRTQLEDAEIETEEVSGGSHARRVIEKFSHLSHAKQQEEWRFWIGVYQCYMPYFAEDVRLLTELLKGYENEKCC